MEDRNSREFVSACKTFDAAKAMLRRPPNPMANVIVELVVEGRVLDMIYDDGPAGDRKQHEDEIIVPITSVKRVSIVDTSL